MINQKSILFLFTILRPPSDAVGTPSDVVGTPSGAVGTPSGAVGTPSGVVGTPSAPLTTLFSIIEGFGAFASTKNLVFAVKSILFDYEIR